MASDQNTAIRPASAEQRGTPVELELIFEVSA